MPYRINPNNAREVQIKKGGKWKKLKLHANAGAARRHLGALSANVRHRAVVVKPRSRE